MFLDYDGTLAPFSVDRQRAVPYPGLRDLLQQIIDVGRTRLVIITGRDAHEIDPFLRLRPAPEIWGSHGLQRLLPDGTCDMPEIPDAVSQVLDDAKRWLEYQGLHDLAGAATAYRRALEKRSDLAEAAINLGIVLQDLGEVDAAMDAYRKAYRLREATFGMIATSLTSAAHGRLWLDRDALKRLLRG